MSATVALARKWRPRRLEEIVGQEHTVQALANGLAAERLHHAYLFTGTRGVGKTTLARILAKAFNCERGISATPCLECQACREVEEGVYLDVAEIDAASHTDADHMREILESAAYLPARGRRKVFIIDEVHMLSRHANNAMLKTLEEPPAHVVFILATTEPQKLPATILSRCLQFNLRQLPRAQIAARLAEVLKAENAEFEDGALELIARLARGSLRDALSLADQALAYGDGKALEAQVRRMVGDAGEEAVGAALEAVVAGDGIAARRVADDLNDRGASFDAVLADLAAEIHRIAVARRFPDAAAERATREFARQMSSDQAQVFYEIAVRARRDLPFAPEERVGFEMALLRMMLFSSAAESESESAPQPAARQTPSLKASASPKADASPPTAADDWDQIVAALPSAAARNLARHCEVLRRDDSGVVLELDSREQSAQLRFADQLCDALKQRFGAAFQVEIKSGAAANSAANQAQARKRELAQDAKQAIAADPFVRDIGRHFPGAQVDDVRPLDRDV